MQGFMQEASSLLSEQVKPANADSNKFVVYWNAVAYILDGSELVVHCLCTGQRAARLAGGVFYNGEMQ